MEKIILVIIASVPVLYQIVGLEHSEYKYIQYIPMLLLNLILISYFYKNKIRLQKESLIIFWLLSMAVIMVPFVMSKISETVFLENINQTLFYADFIVMILLISNYMREKKYKHVIGSLLVGNTIILIINVIKNLNNISMDNGKENIIQILKFVDQKEVFYFSFNHPNLVSMFIIIEMLLLYRYQEFVTNIKVRVCFDLLVILWIIPLLITGSRTAIVCAVIFLISKIFLRCFFKVENKWKFLVVTISIALLCIVAGKIDFTKINLSESMAGRKSDVISLLYYLMDTGKIVTGIGPTNATLSYVHTWGIEGTPDNGYIAIIAQYGVIGFILVMCALGYTFYINFNEKNSMNCALILTLLIYSCVENVFFIPRVWMSVLIWMFIVNFKKYEKNSVLI